MTVAEIRQLFCYNDDNKLSMMWSKEKAVEAYTQIFDVAPKSELTKKAIIEDIREYLVAHDCVCTLKELFGM